VLLCGMQTRGADGQLTRAAGGKTSTCSLWCTDTHPHS
jgi:hypothetical protein